MLRICTNIMQTRQDISCGTTIPYLEWLISARQMLEEVALEHKRQRLMVGQTDGRRDTVAVATRGCRTSVRRNVEIFEGSAKRNTCSDTYEEAQEGGVRGYTFKSKN